MAWQAYQIAAPAEPALACAAPASPSPGRPEYRSDPTSITVQWRALAADGERV